ncbi:MAG: lysophospholipid acyltransferase family protein [Bacteroidetes bacterium]|nr:lysophospholipid acyltransferase family protein [Bacteroidota bacterium]MBU1484385.1 lysophospholipid acyltransferase family protein [Bacteroidota bacterium]MBU2268611.1 lysophospholipid acyltransferase family protein [Bacteroidota bacterium]MBU2374499.1 lysophospholipid acyltransferase family protein [Bacteroidota bacterium]
MVKPQSNKIIHQFFSWYISRIIKSDFDRFEYNDIKIEDNKAILLLANHFSWWDGFLLFHLNKIYFKKHFHVMVLQDTAEKVKFLKYLGAFSIQKNAKSLVESLDYAGKLLDNPANLVLIFPQGELYSSHSAAIQFEKGVSRIIAASKKQFQYIFAAVLTDYFDRRKPSIKAYLEHWEAKEYNSLQVIKSAYNKHYEQAIKQQTEVSV